MQQIFLRASYTIEISLEHLWCQGAPFLLNCPNILHRECQTHQDKGNGNDVLVDVPKFRNHIKYERVPERSPLDPTWRRIFPSYPRMILADHNIVLWQVSSPPGKICHSAQFQSTKSVFLFNITLKCGMSFRLCQLQYSLWNKSCGQPALSGQCFQTSLWFCWTPWCLLAGTPTKTCQILWRGSWKENYESFKCCDTLNIGN